MSRNEKVHLPDGFIIHMTRTTDGQTIKCEALVREFHEFESSLCPSSPHLAIYK